MLRKISSLTLSVSFIALITSGLFIMFNSEIESQIKMHPIHNLVAILFVISGIIHIILNAKLLSKYFCAKPYLIYSMFLLFLFTFLYYAGLNRKVDLAGKRDVNIVTIEAKSRK